ncbi:MAG TPA: hypothetical protein VMF08_01725 [Candidatus Sulfotelmatobacter sp.]|nr:hypothetical protein [Candidatus Sulfotelmatobacter sp.]
MIPDPKKTVVLDPDHSIEIGQSTWDPSEMSVRRNYHPNGKFSPHGSSEIPIWALKAIIEAVANNDELEPKDCVDIIKSLAGSVYRRLP